MKDQVWEQAQMRRLLCFSSVILQSCFQPPPELSSISLFCSCILQLIQTVSAVDQDDPLEGQHFYYSLAPEAANNPNFTLRDNQGNWSGHPFVLLTNIFCSELDLRGSDLTLRHKSATASNAK